MHPDQIRLLAAERICDAERATGTSDDLAGAGGGLLLRPARPDDDAVALRERTPLLVAEVDGEIAAGVFRTGERDP